MLCDDIFGGLRKLLYMEKSGLPHRILFQDLEVWKQAVVLAGDIQRATANFRGISAALRDQMNASVESVSSNIAEAEGRATNKDSLRIYYIARGSLWELRSQLAVCETRSLISQADLNPIIIQTDIVGRLVSGVIRLRRRREEASNSKRNTGRGTSPGL